MPRKSLDTLLQREMDTLTQEEQGRVFTGVFRLAGYRMPGDRVYKYELPRCGARCRDGHPCQANATRDAETGCYVRNGRCRLHGGLSTGPRTKAGKRRGGVAARGVWRRQTPAKCPRQDNAEGALPHRTRRNENESAL
jgi:hypothetical protein